MVLTALVCLFSAPAGAGQASPPAAGADPEAPRAPGAKAPKDDNKAAAKAAFDEGLAAAAAGEFEAAIAHFGRAQQLRPHPTTLFNLAYALERAGRLPEAWALFDAILDTVDSQTERSDVRTRMQAIEGRIAVLEVSAEPRERLCIDGHDMPQVGGSYRVALEPGDHTLLLDAKEVQARLHAGERRVLLLDARVPPPSATPPPRPRSIPAMAGLASGTGALALGLGVGSILATEQPPGLKLGLGAGAAASAGVAMGAGLAALLLDRRFERQVQGLPPRRKRRREVDRAPAACPGSPSLDDRVDLELLPDIIQPASFASAIELPPALPIALPPLENFGGNFGGNFGDAFGPGDIKSAP
ncbi:hypothetical protein PPSIR1_16100 [Plesiocystis pacifica SIR-1]|uniref:Uncharacterized protein n=1 Tax=Plesiocystis pacifica SIR-1 TaxID=391625 RepID=A6GAU8_9BACT|nr:hypothetical protein PPSIR1_16100 [Plesiocystis pacifica SIR-1]